LLSAPFPAGAGPGPLGRGRACLVQVGHTLRLTDLDQAGAVWWPLMRARCVPGPPAIPERPGARAGSPGRRRLSRV